MDEKTAGASFTVLACKYLLSVQPCLSTIVFIMGLRQLLRMKPHDCSLQKMPSYPVPDEGKAHEAEVLGKWFRQILIEQVLTGTRKGILKIPKRQTQTHISENQPGPYGQQWRSVIGTSNPGTQGQPKSQSRIQRVLRRPGGKCRGRAHPTS